jgi:nicotinate-nucleotide--dimethylbenzimidazole phosphoribosyltransferase
MHTNSEQLEARVRRRLDSLLKPVGSLGRMEEVIVQFALATGEEIPSARRKGMYVFCADHGVTDEGVSAYPRSVTAQMLANFLSGGAAINVLCEHLGIATRIVDVGVDGPRGSPDIDRKIGNGTRNFAVAPAMTTEEARRALAVGAGMAEDAAGRFDIAGLGEMGIGNTTSAAALLAVFAGSDPAETVGSGAGSNASGMARKADVIRRALALHKPQPADGIGVLAAVGGFEIGAIAGFLLRASELCLPVVVDGFPCGAAALVARAIRPDSLRHVFYAHRSAERGHKLMLDTLGARPLLDLGMRLGEGTGAALAMTIIESAITLYRGMRTFEEASVNRSSMD